MCKGNIKNLSHIEKGRASTNWVYLEEVWRAPSLQTMVYSLRAQRDTGVTSSG